MSELPPTWAEIKLGDAIDYGRTSKAEPTEIPNDAWLLELEDIEKDTSKLLVRVTFGERQSKSTKNRFSTGDVLYGKLRPYLNKVLRADRDGFCTTEIVPLKANSAVDGGYLFHWVCHPRFLDYVTNVSHGLNMPRLGTDAGRQAPFVLAPIEEQRRIASKLNILRSRVDSCRERLSRVPRILKQFRESVLDAAVSGRLTEGWRTERSIASLWQRHSLRDLTVLITKGASPRWQGFSYVETGAGGVLFVTSENVRDMHMDLSQPKYVDASFNSAQPRSILRRGDLLTNIVGASIGRSAIYDLDEQANINQAVCVIRRKGTVSGRFLLYSLSAPKTLAFMHGKKVDVARANLSLEDVGNIPIQLPSAEEQEEVVRRVDELLMLADSLQRRYDDASARAEKLTPSVLAKAFRGELVPQDPNDEPAGDMLDRIRRIKETAVAIKPKIRKTPKALIGTGDLRPESSTITSPSPLSDLLKKPRRLRPEQLLALSGLEVDEFYYQLKIEEANGLLREVRSGKGDIDRWLEVIQ